ncbi:MAG TPA: hypothetical protein VIF12_00710 [Micavibrio sp.]
MFRLLGKAASYLGSKIPAVTEFLGFTTRNIVSTDSGQIIAKATEANKLASKAALLAGKAAEVTTKTPKKGLLRLSLGALTGAGIDQYATDGKVTGVVVDGASAVVKGGGKVLGAGAKNLDDKITGGKGKEVVDGAKDMVTGDSKAGEEGDNPIMNGAGELIKDNWGAILLGGLFGANTEGGVGKKLLWGTIWAAVLPVIWHFAKPFLQPVINWAKDAFTGYYSQYGSKGKSASGAGAAQFTQKTETPAVATAAPTGAQPTPTADGAHPVLYAVQDLVKPRLLTIEEKVEQRIEQMRATSPDAVQLSSRKNEEQFRRLLTQQYTDEQQAQSAPPASGPAQNKKLATGPVELSLA